MNSRKNKIQRLTLAAFFVAIEVLMGTTPIGYIPLGPLSITTMHLPVLLGGILLGEKFGMMMGFTFGLISFLRATFAPGITSFVFTPFITVGNMHGNFASLLICFGPRIFMGYFSAVLYRILKKFTHRDIVSVFTSALLNTVIHTLLVLGGIWLFFAEPYASALNVSLAGLAAAFLATITSNGILEAVEAAIVIPALYKALSATVERMGLKNG